MRSLAIVERAYRGAIEEQYAHVLWVVHCLRRVPEEIDLMLRTPATLYACQNQPHTQLQIGRITLDTLPRYESTIENLLSDGVKVYVVKDDCNRLQIKVSQLMQGVCALEHEQLPQIFEEYDHIWYW
ncbi:MAG: hypothetical protein C6Y22_24955 [Hapalosiphonaceae cyanobacterium JJU2]|nr:MAG: hypothetical protein C6Y22_24955 [Hapalosiphonaceae cyanobacterium JJU2]